MQPPGLSQRLSAFKFPPRGTKLHAPHCRFCLCRLQALRARSRFGECGRRPHKAEAKPSNAGPRGLRGGGPRAVWEGHNTHRSLPHSHTNLPKITAFSLPRLSEHGPLPTARVASPSRRRTRATRHRRSLHKNFLRPVHPLRPPSLDRTRQQTPSPRTQGPRGLWGGGPRAVWEGPQHPSKPPSLAHQPPQNHRALTPPTV